MSAAGAGDDAPRAHPSRDVGLQPERTALAWQRTILSVTVGSLVCGATALRLDQPVIVVAAAAVAIAAMLPSVLRLPEGGLPSHGHLRSWRFLVRMVLLVSALGAVGTAAALVSMLQGDG
ncbi:DUF202 domain-containing protein [Cellulomonas sp. PhB143]|uniref:DUF202 domain-containing protein n=1 Tax=Cellulomonas sp. PhB143 TaxID=2485186 RepID=UPI0013157A92|nr:DUF202 domain-containing protein [Cellulomonas sp. PhB143]